MPLENGLIDLRSDTVTQPTPAMREAMYRAEVGDDVSDEDPTVNRLQDRAAELMGQAAGLFVASGTMGNLLALMTHCARFSRGVEVIAGDHSHIYLNETGGMAALVGAQASPIPNQPDGTLRLDDIANAIRMEDPHHPRTRLVCLENTQNQCGGAALTPAYTQQVADFAHSQGLLLHIDGARIFNAAVAQNVDVKTLAAPADSVTFCLSKGLGAPVGSVLCGSHDFIYEAKRYRKMVGGGMRQVGVIAAAGHVALDSMIERLDDDHTHARQLAEGLRTIPGLAVEAQVPTNMIYFSLTPAAKLSEAALVAEMHARGIVMYGADFGRFRLVTHYWVSATDVEKVVGALREVLH